MQTHVLLIFDCRFHNARGPERRTIDEGIFDRGVDNAEFVAAVLNGKRLGIMGSFGGGRGAAKQRGWTSASAYVESAYWKGLINPDSIGFNLLAHRVIVGFWRAGEYGDCSGRG